MKESMLPYMSTSWIWGVGSLVGAWSNCRKTPTFGNHVVFPYIPDWNKWGKLVTLGVWSTLRPFTSPNKRLYLHSLICKRYCNQCERQDLTIIILMMITHNIRRPGHVCWWSYWWSILMILSVQNVLTGGVSCLWHLQGNKRYCTLLIMQRQQCTTWKMERGRRQKKIKKRWRRLDDDAPLKVLSFKIRARTRNMRL